MLSPKKKNTWYRSFTNVNVSVLAFISFYIHLFYELPANIVGQYKLNLHYSVHMLFSDD